MKFLAWCVLSDKKLYGNCLHWLKYTVLKIFSPCPEKQSLPWNFLLYWIYFLSFRIFEQLALVLKNRVCPEIFPCRTYWVYFYIHDIWATCACPEKQSVPWINCIEYTFFHHSVFLSKLRLPWKTRVAQKFFTVLKYFSSFRVFEQLALALKNRLCPELNVLNIHFLSFRVFEQLALALKTRVHSEVFRCIEIFFIIQHFWATCACPEKQSVPWINCIEYIFFIIQCFRATCACPENQSCPEIVHCIEIFFTIQYFWATCACPENRVCSEIFQDGGSGRPPRPPTSYAYGYHDEIFIFTGVKRTKHWINVHLFDNANDYTIQKTSLKKYQMTDSWRRLASERETLQCLLSV